MAELSDVAFNTKYNDATTGLYRDGQGASAITPLRHRTLAEDIKDSFHNNLRLDIVSIDPTISPVFQFSNRNTHWNFIISAIATTYTWTLSNADYAYKFTFLIEFSGLHAQTFPSNFKMSDTRWNSSTKIFTPLETGKYKGVCEFDGTDWYMDITPYPYS